MQTLLDLVFFSNKKSKWQKNGSNWISPENRQMALFGGEGLRDKPWIHEESKKNFFLHFWIIFDFIIIIIITIYLFNVDKKKSKKYS